MVKVLRLGAAFACAVLVSTTMKAHEVPVHRRITYKALEYLATFRPELDASCRATLNLHIGKGVEREDDLFPDAPSGLLDPPLGRFMFHFLPALSDVPAVWEFATGALRAFAEGSCDSDTWGHRKEVCSATVDVMGKVYASGPHSNELTYDELIRGLKDPVGSPSHTLALEGLGHYLHLLQDLTSPAHTRNDAHPHPEWDLSNKLGDPSLFEVLNKEREIGWPSTGLEPFTSPQAAFRQLQAWTASRFWSEKNTLVGFPPGPEKDRMVGAYAMDAEGRRIAYQEARTKQFTINDVIAREQFDELAPEAVRYTASMIDYIIKTERVELCGSSPAQAIYDVNTDVSYYGPDALQCGDYRNRSVPATVRVSGVSPTTPGRAEVFVSAATLNIGAGNHPSSCPATVSTGAFAMAHDLEFYKSTDGRLWRKHYDAAGHDDITLECAPTGIATNCSVVGFSHTTAQMPPQFIRVGGCRDSVSCENARRR